MLLSFSETFPDKTATNFEFQILTGTKTHTFRFGERWSAGKAIHMVVHARSSDQRQFNTHRPELSTCHGTQKFRVGADRMNGRNPDRDGLYLEIETVAHGWQRRLLHSVELDLVARNDGFQRGEQLLDWFRKEVLKAGPEPRTGQIVHWTDFRY